MSDINDRSLEETAQRFRHSSREQIDWTTPADGSWERISSALGFPPVQESGTPPGAAGPSFVNPGGATSGEATPSGSAFPGAGRTASPTRPQGIPRRTLFTGLGGVIVGAILGAGAMRLTQTEAAPVVPVRSAVLRPLNDADVELGVATLRPLDAGYSLAVDVPEGVEHPGGYIEVWLIHTDLSTVRMVSVGVFAAGTDAQFHVSADLIEQGYLIVDLSNEEFDTEARHSADTVMRGELLA